MKKGKSIDGVEVGRRIREKREELNLTREKFAEIVDLSSLYVGQLERGERQMSLTALVKIANCLHVTTDYLIYGEHKGQIKDMLIKEKLKKYQLPKTEDNAILYKLLERCSKRELDLIESMVKLILPYIR
ncbi:helix-turn-helix domain-containing protein [Clostridium luticellarii]|jgi:transcriptional regulator with XRE-family HTH domain|uniref:Anaerobic benzoate catabolism transcriptional regulator n=1 Tax=Clostridium luticellarii TaxID=1691940 RepID=A0A2T0BQK4_9CLOT|nr:helix-turn-helix domain-containing protein [Clostridium luticellarii]MCI1944766.1 helix-turn-helix domain-containing protein [Clostridium luticellarii]MCI1968261.1 helix-turn-helix domain-containing protein [Clostridium luticellarii]MCI1995702.1 helix-turn-helix domain-containing protein [Clostridium luticellarii]MCI2040218.1 helix-turn-helix domain-containing protein [Clostridium luticellarii]PRR86136.1 anaerobic benzoate catabolism transcriptional regulator [Clostridium luticellarii]